MKARNTRRLTIFGVALCAMGLLLWARLILVTGRPRTAIADPESKQTQTPKDSGASKPENTTPRTPEDSESREESTRPKAR